MNKRCDPLLNLLLMLKTDRKAQQKIEDIAITDDNIPAYKLLLDEAAPREKTMLSNSTAIIEEEALLPSLCAVFLFLAILGVGFPFGFYVEAVL